MTDRHAGYLITLEQDIHEDDANITLNAIRQIRGVLEVVPIIRDMTVGDAIVKERVRAWILRRLQALYDETERT